MEIAIYYGNESHYVDITGAAIINWYNRKTRELHIPSSEGARLRMLDSKITAPSGPNHIKVVKGTVVLPVMVAAKVPLNDPVKVWYGAASHYVDVTKEAYEAWRRTADQDHSNSYYVLDIPAGDDVRCRTLGKGDPAPGLFKEIRVVPVLAGAPNTIVAGGDAILLPVNVDFATIGEKIITYLHTTLRLVGGSMIDEYPEQVMVAKYLRPDATVLELGSNIGRNTLIISSILDDPSRLVTVECDPATAKQLRVNGDVNEFDFKICNAALSKRRLVQKGWDTISLENDDPVPEGYTEVKTVSYQFIKDQYGMKFDTLVADVEGALAGILADMPEILDDISTLIVENDYKDVMIKHAVDKVLLNKGFKVVHRELGPSWLIQHCHDFFYEVWSKQA